MSTHPHRWFLAVALVAARGDAQRPAPPVRSLGPVLATSTMTFTVATANPAFEEATPVRGLKDGRVFVADPGTRQLMLIDRALQSPRPVVDTTATPVSYTAGSYLSSLVGDSAMFYATGRGNVFAVIDNKGVVARTIPAPLLPGAGRGAPQGALGRAMFSPLHGLVYRTPFMRVTGLPRRPAAGDADVAFTRDDSQNVVRLNLATRRLDTLDRIGAGTRTRYALTSDSGRSPLRAGTPTSFLPFLDDVVVTTDGSVAIFRAREYSVEWIGPGGRRNNAVIDYPWRLVPDDERRRLLDSMTSANRRSYEQAVARRAADSARTGLPPVTTRVVIGRRGAQSISDEPTPPLVPPAPATDADLPRAFPPTGPHAFLADADNNVWIRPIRPDSEPGFSVWDVVNRQGELTDRIRIPSDRWIMGFGPGVVYLSLPTAGVIRMERVRFKR